MSFRSFEMAQRRGVFLLALLAMTTIDSAYSSLELARDTCSAEDRNMDIEMNGASVQLMGLFPISSTSGLSGCVNLGFRKEAYGIILHQAAKFALMSLNNNARFKIGMRAYDTCSSRVVANMAIRDFYPQMAATSAQCTNTSSAVVKPGVVGGYHDIVVQATSTLLNQLQVPQISYGPTSRTLAFQAPRPYLLRLGSDDDSLIQAVIAVLKHLKWYYYGIVHSPRDFSQQFYNKLLLESTKSGLCVAVTMIVDRKISPLEIRDGIDRFIRDDITGVVYLGSYSNARYFFNDAFNRSNNDAGQLQWLFPRLRRDSLLPQNLVGSVFIEQRSTQPQTGFHQYFQGLNPRDEGVWFSDWYMAYFRCKLPGLPSPHPSFTSTCRTPHSVNLRQLNLLHDSIQSVIDAVNVFSQALNDASTSGHLHSLTSVQFFNSYLSRAFHSKFGASGSMIKYRGFDIVNLRLSRNNFGEYVTVGNFTSQGLSVDNITMYNNRRDASLPSIPQSSCMRNKCRYCTRSQRPTPYHMTHGTLLIGGLYSVHANVDGSCGQLDIQQAYTALAFSYAVDAVNRTVNTLDIGGLFVDSCNNPARAIHFIQGIHGGAGLSVDPDSIIGYTDNLDTDQTAVVSPLIASYGVPQLSSVATTTMFKDDESVPLYSSAAPSDYQHAYAINAFLDYNKWRFVQVVSDTDKRSAALVKEFNAVTIKSSICVAASYEMKNIAEAATIFSQLQLKPAAKIVVVIGSPATFRSLLQAIKVADAVGQFILILADYEGMTAEFVQGVKNEANGNFLVRLSTHKQDQDFNQYLNSLHTDSSKIPFFRELYQEQYSCYLSNALRGRYTQPCRNQKMTLNPLYINSVVFTIQSVNDLTVALVRVLREVCGRVEVCPGVKNITDLRQRIHSKLSPNSGSYSIINYQAPEQDPFVEVGKMSIPDKKYTQTSVRIILPAHQTLGPVQCDHFCSECLYLHNHEPYVYKQGQIVIGASISRHGDVHDNPFACGNEKSTGFQHSAAVRYAVGEVNAGRGPTLNGVKLGVLIYDVCDSSEKAASLVSGVFNGMVNPPLPKFHIEQLRGWLSFPAGATKNTATFLGRFGIPVVTPYADSISDISAYPTLFSTVARTDKLGHVIGKFLKYLGNFHYVNILHSNTKLGKRSAVMVNSVIAEYGICVLRKFPMSTNMRNNILDLVSSSTHVVIVISDDEKEMLRLMRAKTHESRGNKLLFITSRVWPFAKFIHPAPLNILSVTSRNPNITAYENTLSNDPAFYEMIYQGVFQCDLPGHREHGRSCNVSYPITKSSLYEQDANVVSSINAVYSLTAALHLTLQQKCNDSYTHVCNAFRTDADTNSIIVNYLKRVSFDDITGERFQFTQDRDFVPDHSLQLLETYGYSEVATYSDEKFKVVANDLDTRFSSIISGCDSTCTQCIRHALNITYIPGDLYLTGMFDVHHKSITPFTCGQIKMLHGFQLLEAFQFAIQNVNRNGLLNGVTLGGIGLDGCESAVRSGFLVSNIHQKLITLQRNGETVDPEKIVSYIGTYETARSRYLARILTPLKLPQISYGSTSMELSNVYRYPYFLRTVPADDRQSKVIIDFLKKYKVQYVQVLNSPTSYGELGMKVFSQQAAMNQICIAQTVQFKDNRTVTRESANDAVTQLLRKPLANIVVIFADTSYLKPFLLAVKRNSEAKSKFHFLGTMSWGVNNEVIEDTITEVIGSTTITLQSAAIPEFYKHMYDMKPSGDDNNNPWFNEYYEAIQNCYLSNPERRFPRYPTKCTDSLPNYASTPRFVQDNDAIHVINAVYAAAHGLHATLKETCGSNYRGVCSQFMKRDDRNDLLLEGIRHAQFIDYTGDKFAFEGRSGNKGYTLYSIERSTTTKEGYVYQQIGNYKQSSLTVNTSQVFLSQGRSCEGEGVCSECPGIRNPQTRVKLTPAPYANALSLVAIFDIHSTEASDEFRCGAMTSLKGMKNLLAFHFALDHYNSVMNSTSVTFSGIALDTCSNSIRVNTDLYAIISKNLCHLHKDIDVSQRGQFELDKIGGVVCMGEYNSMAANRVLKPYSVSLVSPDATFSMFRDKDLYPYFMRVLPPDDLQASVVLEIIRAKRWSYISVIYTTNNYGVANNRALIAASAVDGSKICIGLSIGLSETASAGVIADAVNRVHGKTQSGANVVVLFTSYDHTDKIFQAVRTHQPASKIVWIGGTHWGTDTNLLNKHSALMSGAITLRKESDTKYRLANKFPTGRHAGVIPLWYNEFTALLKAQSNSSIEFDDEMLQTMLATWTTAQGIQAAYDKVCEKASVTRCMQDNPVRFRREILVGINKYRWKNLRTFVTGLNIQEFGYNDQYGNLGYVIHRVTSAASGQQQYSHIGIWNGKLQMNAAYKEKTTSFCKAGHTCTCDYGSITTAASTGIDYSSISSLPRNYYYYYDSGEQAYAWPIWAVIMAVLTSLGILVAVILFIILLIIYPNKSGTTILAFLLMIGIIAMYTVNFAFFIHAGRVICGLRRFFLGVVYAICFTALLVKAVDNWRNSDYDSYSFKYQGITSACCLLLIALFIIAVQVFIPVIWLILVPATATNLSPLAATHDYFWCDPPLWYDRFMVLAFVYIILLLVLLIIFAAMSWNRENNLNESRWILFAGCASLSIIMVWMIITTMSPAPYRDVAIAIGNWVTATILLLCFPIRKTVWYAIVRMREKKDGKLREANHTMYKNDGFNDDYSSDLEQKVNLSTNVSYDHAAFTRSLASEERGGGQLRTSGGDHGGGYAVISSGSKNSYNSGSEYRNGNANSGLHASYAETSRSSATGGKAVESQMGGSMIGGNLESAQQQKASTESERESYMIKEKYQKTYTTQTETPRFEGPVPYIETTLEDAAQTRETNDVITTSVNYETFGIEEQQEVMDFFNDEAGLSAHDVEFSTQNFELTPDTPSSVHSSTARYSGLGQHAEPSVTITQAAPDITDSFKSEEYVYDYSMPSVSGHHSGNIKARNMRPTPKIVVTEPPTSRVHSDHSYRSNETRSRPSSVRSPSSDYTA